ISNYVGICGGDVRANDVSRKDGVLFPNSDIRIRDITDGTSNTWMFGERDTVLRAPVFSGQVVQEHMGSVWAAVSGPALPGWSWKNYAWMMVFASPRATFGEINGSYGRIDTRELSSQHVGGIHVALADGSVRFCSENTNLNTAINLAKRDEDRKSVV